MERSRRNSPRIGGGFRAQWPSTRLPCCAPRWQGVARRWPCRWGELDPGWSPSRNASAGWEVKGRRRCGAGRLEVWRPLVRASEPGWPAPPGPGPGWRPIHSATPRPRSVLPWVPLPPARGAVRWLRRNHGRERPGRTLECWPRPPAMTSRPHRAPASPSAAWLNDAACWRRIVAGRRTLQPGRVRCWRWGPAGA